MCHYNIKTITTFYYASSGRKMLTSLKSLKLVIGTMFILIVYTTYLKRDMKNKNDKIGRSC